MSCYLILGNPRSGTSIVNDLLTEQYGCWNLAEDWCLSEDSYSIRRYKKIDPKATAVDYLNNSISFHNELNSRLSYLIDNTERNWVAKIWVRDCTANISIIDQVYSNPNIKMVMTHRRNISEHYTSVVNAAYRRSVLGYGAGEFSYTNKTALRSPLYSEIDWNPNIIVGALNDFIQNLKDWRTIYERYRTKLDIVSFERDIENFNLGHIGVTKETVDSYNKKEEHLIPTPFNTTKFVQQEVYQSCLKLLIKYDYLMDI